MNDAELDELLNTWTVADAPSSLRKSVRARFAARTSRVPKPRVTVSWSAILTGFAAAAGGILLVTSVALPQTHGLPYTVESEFIRYADNGTSTAEMNEISYTWRGNETMVSRSLPDGLDTAMARTVDLFGAIMNHLAQVHQHIFNQPIDLNSRARVIVGCQYPTCHLLEKYIIGSRSDLQSTGCVADNKLMGQATILGRQTKIVQRQVEENRRITLWLSPELSCFPMKILTEESGANGNYRAISARQAVKVNINP